MQSFSNVRAMQAIVAISALLMAAPVAKAQTADQMAAPTKKPFDHAALAERALNRHIRPGYDRLAAAASGLVKAIDRHCATTNNADRKLMEAAFDGVVSAWGRIEHIRFGPVTSDNRLERILFWPDRRGTGARQLSRVLASRDKSVLDPKALAGKSIALQGLTALESALFPATAQPAPAIPEQTFRCRFASAIAVNLGAITNAIAQEWSRPDGYARYWTRPGQGNPHYVLPSETTLALSKSYGEGLERVRDERIAGPLGLNSQRRKTPAVLSRSGRTIKLVSANIEGLSDLFNEGGIRDAILATEFKDPHINVAANLKLIGSELAKVDAIARQLIGPTDPFKSAQTNAQLVAMGFPLKNARIQSRALLTLTADLSFGFNSSDGD